MNMDVCRGDLASSPEAMRTLRVVSVFKVGLDGSLCGKGMSILDSFVL